MIIGQFIAVGGTSGYGEGSGSLPAFTSPSPLFAAAKSTTQIDLSWDDVGADNYVLSRNTVNDEETASEIYSGANKSYSDTGRTINTTYYYFVKAQKTGYSDSSSATVSIATFPYSPALFYLPPGVGNGTLGVSGGTDNEFGTTSGTQGDDIEVLKSIINTSGPTATFNSTKAKVACAGRLNAYKTWCNTATNTTNGYTFSSNVVLNDFTVMARVYGRTNGLATNRVLLGKADGANFIRFSSLNGIQIRIGGSVYNSNYPTPVTQTQWYNIIIKRSGSTVSVGFMALDGTVTFNAGTATASNAITFDRIFGDGVSGSTYDGQCELIAIASSVLNDASIQATFNIMKNSAVTIPAIDNNIVPTVSGWNALSAGNLLVDNTLGSAATASSSRNSRVFVQGGYTYFGLHQKADTTYYLNDQWNAYRFSDSNVSDKQLLGVPFNNTDVHNNGSVFSLGNRIGHLETSVHYDQFTKPENLLFKKSGVNMDLTKVNLMPSGNGFSNIACAKTQYHQPLIFNNKIYVFAQEFCSTTWQQEVTEVNVVMLVSSDGGNYWEKYTIANSGSSTQFFYPYVVYREDGVFDLFINNIQSGARYLYAFKIRSTDQGQTWTSPGGGFSKVITNNNPITRAELITNATVIDGSALAGNAKMFHAFHDPSNDEVYALGGNGSDTGINFHRQIANGAFESPKAVTVTGKTLATTVLSSDGDNSPFAIKRGTGNYDIVVPEANSGNWIQIRANTADDFATACTFTSNLSSNNARKYQRVMPCKNMHYQNNKGMVAMEVVSSTGATEGSALIRNLTT